MWIVVVVFGVLAVNQRCCFATFTMVLNMRGCAEGVCLFGLLVCGLGLLQFNTAAHGAD